MGAIFWYDQLIVLNGCRIIALRQNRASALHSIKQRSQTVIWVEMVPVWPVTVTTQYQLSDLLLSSYLIAPPALQGPRWRAYT